MKSSKRTEHVIPPYPHDGGVVERVDWVFAYGPMLLLSLVAASILAVAHEICRRLTR